MNAKQKNLGSTPFEYFRYSQHWEVLMECIIATRNCAAIFFKNILQGNLMGKIFPILKRVEWNYKKMPFWWPGRINSELLNAVHKYLKHNYAMIKKDGWFVKNETFTHCNFLFLQRKSPMEREAAGECILTSGLWDLSTWPSLKQVL